MCDMETCADCSDECDHTCIACMCCDTCCTCGEADILDDEWDEQEIACAIADWENHALRDEGFA